VNINNISGSGINVFNFGFSEENLNDHWTNGRSDHSREYFSYTKEQYAQEALDLIQSATSDTILGYKNNSGQIVRYDIVKNNFVKGHVNIGIATMFKPIDKINYFFAEESREAVRED
jgi:hypothetical protein